ncbi:GtrA family protein [Methanomicrobium mobile]|uniref:GtrA family protein n=1 Tax=Methanomicrobium mobile TaxID=2205 RepID=UPI0005B28023|nr:GtrA family protein [Methanomicrobium mobile]
MKYISDFKSIEFIGFFVCGAIAAAVNITSRIIFNAILPSYVISILLAFVAGLLTGFILDKYLIFKKSKTSTEWQICAFIAINIIGVLQTVVFSLLFYEIIFPAINWTFYPDTIAHMIGVGIPVFTSYLGHKYISFAN